MALCSSPVPNIQRRLSVEEMSAAYKIHHWRYGIHISGIFLKSPEYQADIGYITSGDAAVDQVQARADVLAQYTIIDMAELVAEGIPFRISRPEDCAPIYEIIQQHMQDISRYLHDNINAVSPPEKEIAALDELARTVYTYARKYLTGRKAVTAMERRLAAMSARRSVNRASMEENRNKRLNRDVHAVVYDEKPAKALEPPPPEYSSLAQSIIDVTRERKSQWR